MADTVTGTTGDDDLTGTGVNVVEGLEGDDTLRGAGGDDTLVGGAGDDTYVLTRSGWPDWTGDVVIEAADGGIDTVIDLAGVGSPLGVNIENYIGSLGRGNALANVMTALPAVDTGWGVRGSDSWFWGGEGADTLNGASGDDELHGEAGDDLLVGNHVPDELPGAYDEDELDGGAGIDTMIGGVGMDAYWAHEVGDLIVEEAAPAGMSELDAYYAYHWDTAYWTGEGQYVLADNVERLHLRSDDPDGGFGVSAVGNAQGNVIYSDYGSFNVVLGDVGEGEVGIDGGAGDDTILGGYGAGDTLSGGDGADRVEGGGGSDRIAGGEGADDVTGDHYWDELGADTIDGESGDDTLNGFNGDDSMVGGVGNDVITGDFGDDMVIGGEGDDLVYGAYHDDTLVGGEGADRIGGGQGVNVALDFVDGVDLILGEAAFEDLVIAQDGLDTVITHADEWGGSSSLRLVGVSADAITAEDFLFLRQGTVNDDSMSGGDGDDYVSGGDGDDTLDGGEGGDGVAGGGGDDTLDGGGGDDTVDGGNGDDTLSGGGGDDTLAGGVGDDTFYVDSGDVAEEDAGEGSDTVVSAATYGLGANIEDLVLGDGAGAAALRIMSGLSGPMDGAKATLDGYGNALNNHITGSSGANRLWGLDGKDAIAAGGGNDKLYGGRGNDKLDGGAGRDVLQGDLGADKLAGGAGADTFRYASLRDGGDRIGDFDAAGGDVIDLSAIDARAHRADDQAFTFVNRFHGREGEALLTYNAAKDRTTLQLDVDGDAQADFVLTLDGHATSGAGWVL